VNSSFRLRNSADFERVRAERRTAGDRLLRVQVRGNDVGHPRVGISASKRLGCAVQRNLVRRRLLMAAAAEVPSLQAVDIVLIPTPQGAQSRFSDLEASLANNLNRLQVRAR
jgi:ribonuclease P protein component